MPVPVNDLLHILYLHHFNDRFIRFKSFQGTAHDPWRAVRGFQNVMGVMAPCLVQDRQFSL